jgi:pantetheine-phosphate adenylyltransferase
MKRVIFPGSFDPITMGHLDIIERSVGLFDEIIVAVLDNPDKNPMFSPQERCDMIENVITDLESKGCTLRVESFQGLLVDYAKKREAVCIVRGIRAVSDYEYELRMALMNRKLEPEIETVFLMAAEEFSYVSSRLLKQVFNLGGCVKGLVPPLIEERMREKNGG